MKTEFRRDDPALDVVTIKKPALATIVLYPHELASASASNKNSSNSIAGTPRKDTQAINKTQKSQGMSQQEQTELAAFRRSLEPPKVGTMQDALRRENLKRKGFIPRFER